MSKTCLIVSLLILLGCVSPGAPKMERNVKIFKYHSDFNMWCRLTKSDDYAVIPENELVIDDEGRQLECTDAYSVNNAIISYDDIGVITRKIIKDETLCEKWNPDNLPEKSIKKYSKKILKKY